EEVEALFQQVCREKGFAPLSLGVVATALLKADEPGLREVAAGHGVPLRAFGLEELAGVGPVPTPSERARARRWAAGVAGPSAMRTAGAASPVMPKSRGRRVTLALARREACPSTSSEPAPATPTC